MTIKEWMALVGATCKTDDEILDHEMTDEILNDVYNSLAEAVVYKNVIDSAITEAKIDKLFADVLASCYPPEKMIAFAYDEEDAERMREYFPNYDVRVITPFIAKDFEKGKVYLIPTEDKPVKVVYEN